jgi:hypothetical protein
MNIKLWSTYPRISHNPILCAVLISPANNRNNVVNPWARIIKAEDSTSVVLESIVSGNTTGNWTASKDLSFHFVLSGNRAIIRNLPNLVVLNSETLSECCASVALSHVCARLVFSLIVVAGFVRNSMLSGVGINWEVLF